MPVIAIPLISNGKHAAITCGCTFEEYEQYMQNNDINVNIHTIPTSFFVDYITKHNYVINDIKKMTNCIDKQKDDFITSLTLLQTITIFTVKQILNGLNLEYNDFIDAYAKYLKSLYVD